ncbi:hypothetical protein GCM10017600_04670 [Streptosporangium carneum]|uniref:Uncharacterized protein n=1 Tax=Streptosporangium carneum TaxID=47481 RepID=A0A9W6MAJ3_9ACTN|nr:hypothetical protein GCM10017600_04670 [Streptosporangium carneum]
MRTGYNEALAMLGYLLGAVASSVLVEWAHEGGRESLGEVLLMCSLLFEVAFLFGVVRLLFRGVRWGGRVFARRGRTTTPQDPPGSPGR